MEVMEFVRKVYAESVLDVEWSNGKMMKKVVVSEGSRLKKVRV